jgi:hypothetical protein
VIYRCIIGLFLVIGSYHVALADNWGHPMRFELIPKHGSGLFSNDQSAILGDGDIVANTPDLLQQFLIQNRIPPGTEIHLNSRGGEVDPGIKMGRIIRANRLQTWVGGYNQWDHRSFKQMSESTGSDNYYAYCISSCTIAFLGGVERREDLGEYAVHMVKFECVDPNQPEQHNDVSSCLTVEKATIDIQALIGDIVTYVNEMGIDPRFVVEMTKAKPENTNSLSTEHMLEYKILTRY